MGGYLNYRYIGFPATIGHMAFAFTVSLILILLNKAGWLHVQAASILMRKIDFSAILLHGMLSFLLFAGALHIDLEELYSVKRAVGVLATAGVVIATFVTGSLVWLSFRRSSAADFLSVCLIVWRTDFSYRSHRRSFHS